MIKPDFTEHYYDSNQQVHSVLLNHDNITTHQLLHISAPVVGSLMMGQWGPKHVGVGVL